MHDAAKAYVGAASLEPEGQGVDGIRRLVWALSLQGMVVVLLALVGTARALADDGSTPSTAQLQLVGAGILAGAPLLTAWHLSRLPRAVRRSAGTGAAD